ncbi:MAG: hypothetical protein FMNOHCHN_03770 [Ignavibacteriaceae bacterium]|nr:hypothetical protein [Ignavibacteriaceae bacterium]
MKKLFLENEYVCHGSLESTNVTLFKPDINSEFFSINPIHPSLDYGWNKKPNLYNFNTPRRADINVTKFRNLLFEMDGIDLNQQLEMLDALPLKFTYITYSGNKSYHAIVSLQNDLPYEAHTEKAIEQYRSLWSKLCALFDKILIEKGYNLPINKKSFFDPATKNPSRLSRTPNAIRSNGVKQQLVYEGDFLTEELLLELLSSAPIDEERPYIKLDKTELECKTHDQFMAVIPSGLYIQLKFPQNWAAPEGLYPIMFRLALWAIDSCGVRKNILLNFMSKNTFPVLLKAGYPEHKLQKPIDHAYLLKGLE